MALSGDQLVELRQRLEEKFGIVKERFGIEVTPSARAVIHAALAGIVDEPSRGWPASLREREADRLGLYDQAIEALPSHLLSLRHGLNDATITVFDAINYAAHLSVHCCMISIPGEL